MVVASYIVAHTILAICAAALLCNFLLQLLVERRAEYDRGQLYAKLRVEDWRTEQKNKKSDKDSSGGGETNRSVSSSGGSHTPRPKPLVVGFTQWSVHRVGFGASLLLAIRCIDPFSVLGVLPVRFNSFLNWNINAFVYTFALIAFLYPIHLVRIIALRRQSPVLVWTGISLSVISFILAELMPGLYIEYGEKGSIRAVPNFWYIGSIFFVTMIYNVYMHRLARSINELIEWRDKMRSNLANYPQSEPRPSAVALAVVVSDLESPRTQEPESQNQQPQNDSLPPLPLPTPSHSNTAPSPKADDSEYSREPSAHSSNVNQSGPQLDANPPRNAEPRESATQRMSVQSVKNYKALMAKLRLTQVFGNIALLVIVIGVLIIGIDAIKHKDEDANKPKGDDFSSASFSVLFSYFHVFVLAVAAWYSYLPISTLFQPKAEIPV